MFLLAMRRPQNERPWSRLSSAGERGTAGLGSGLLACSALATPLPSRREARAAPIHKEDVMKTARILSLVVGTALCFVAASASAQAPPPYGPPITLEQAKKAMAGAEAEA